MEERSDFSKQNNAAHIVRIHSSLVTRHSSLVTRHSSLVTRHSSLVTRLAQLDAWDGVIEVCVCDLSSSEDRQSVVRGVLSRGRVEILVNNAGYSQRAGFSDLGVNGVRDMFEVNFFAGVDIMEMCLPGMREGKGVVIWVSSVQGLLPLPGRSGYSASKHAINGFAGSVRAELEGEVEVIVVNPGYVKTNLSSNAVGEVRIVAMTSCRLHKCFLCLLFCSLLALCTKRLTPQLSLAVSSPPNHPGWEEVGSA